MTKSKPRLKSASASPKRRPLAREIVLPNDQIFPDDVYALQADGDCMAPSVHSGDSIICSPSAPVEVGKLVAIFFKKGKIGAVKRVVDLPPADLMASAFAGKCIGFTPIMHVEQTNPPRRYAVALDGISHMHRVVAVVRREEAAHV